MNYAKHLREIGLKATTQRMRILHLFNQSKIRHLSAEDVYRQLMKLNVSIGIATVYRVLTQFADAGILVRRNFDPARAMYELDDGKHNHLICSKCSNVIKFQDDDVERMHRLIAKKHGFRIKKYEVYLYGYCNHHCCSSDDLEESEGTDSRLGLGAL